MSQPILIRSLSSREARLLSTLAAAGRTIFTIEEARQTSDADGADVARLLYRLAAKRWVQRLERGKYRLIPLEAGPEARAGGRRAWRCGTRRTR